MPRARQSRCSAGGAGSVRAGHTPSLAVRRLLLVPLLLLAACDSGPSFGDDFLSVYSFTAFNASGQSEGAVLTRGRIGLTYIPSDVSSIPDGWQGQWDLRAAADGGTMEGAVDGEGTISGQTLEDGTIELRFAVLVGSRADAEIGYRLRGSFEDDGERFVGTWTSYGGFTGGPLFSGPFEAQLTRRATEFIIAG